MHKQLENSLYKQYAKDIVPNMMKIFNMNNFYEVPRIEKVVLNMGLKKAKEDKTVLDEAMKDISSITGQKPVLTKAKKSISNFSMRAGTPIGCMVTLRGKFMYEFLEKLIRVVIPRIRDFSGLKKSFDDGGNLTIGIIDESIFPEIDADRIKTIKGIGITVVTSGYDREKSEKMMELIGFPFVK